MNEATREFENSLNLWLPEDGEVDISRLQSLNRCQSGLDRLLHGEINPQEFCDILQTEQVDMDVYLDTATDNLAAAGL